MNNETPSNSVISDSNIKTFEQNSDTKHEEYSPFIEHDDPPINLDESLNSVETNKIFGISISWALGIFLVTIVGLVLLWWFWPSEQPAINDKPKKKKVKFNDEVQQKEIPPEDSLAELDLNSYMPPEKPVVVSPYKTKPSVINKIIDGLFISDDYSSRDYETIKTLGITQILCVGQELTPHTNSGFVTAHIPIVDMESALIKKWFGTAISFIRTGPTLVHCSQGISRSATICAAYLIANGSTYDDALAKIKSARSMACPNEGFVEQLKEFEKTRQPVEGFELKISK